MDIKLLTKKFRIKNGHLVSSLDGRRVGSRRGKTHKVMIEGIYYQTEEVLAALVNYMSNPKAITITKDGEYETVMGNPVRITHDDGPITAPFIGAIYIDNAWHACMWAMNGTTYHTDYNLVEKQQCPQ
jgi:hypothetical protein